MSRRQPKPSVQASTAHVRDLVRLRLVERRQAQRGQQLDQARFPSCATRPLDDLGIDEYLGILAAVEQELEEIAASEYLEYERQFLLEMQRRLDTARCPICDALTGAPNQICANCAKYCD